MAEKQQDLSKGSNWGDIDQDSELKQAFKNTDISTGEGLDDFLKKAVCAMKKGDFTGFFWHAYQSGQFEQEQSGQDGTQK